MSLEIPKVAAIHDLSGFGRTSLMVVIPILSALGVQVCPLPTAVLSTHTSGFDEYSFVDLSSSMKAFLQHWQKLQLGFNAVYSGFLASPDQVDIVAECIDTCLLKEGIALVDPVLGDNGVLDPTMSLEMVERMRWLIRKANCISPNFTEATFLLGESYPRFEAGELLSEEKLKKWLLNLSKMGPELVVITSVPMLADEKSYSVVAYDKRKDSYLRVDYEQITAFYPGTGDAFASILTGILLKKIPLKKGIEVATHFIAEAITSSLNEKKLAREGICLEAGLLSLSNDLLAIKRDK